MTILEREAMDAIVELHRAARTVLASRTVRFLRQEDRAALDQATSKAWVVYASLWASAHPEEMIFRK